MFNTLISLSCSQYNASYHYAKGAIRTAAAAGHATARNLKNWLCILKIEHTYSSNGTFSTQSLNCSSCTQADVLFLVQFKTSTLPVDAYRPPYFSVLKVIGHGDETRVEKWEKMYVPVELDPVALTPSQGPQYTPLQCISALPPLLPCFLACAMPPYTYAAYSIHII